MPRPVSNPPNPWATAHVEWIGEPPPAALQIYEENARSVLTKNDSPDVTFTWGVNPYRGCFHGCNYCYARPTHEYLDFGAGTDFDRKIVAKVNAPDVLRRELTRRSWQGELICFSGVTDCYQPMEASYELTRRCLEVCLDFRNPVGVITKGLLVRRDIDVLAELAERAHATVFMSIPFADARTSRLVEPFAPPPRQRFETLRALSEAGIETGIGIAPIIPGLNESDIPALLEEARDAGATRAFTILLRLPGAVHAVFESRMREAFPDRYAKIENAVKEMKGGRLNRSAFGERMRGTGERWEMTQRLFRATCRRLGIEAEGGRPPRYATFRRPDAQPGLFD